MRALVLAFPMLLSAAAVLIAIVQYERRLPIFRSAGPIALTARTAETLDPPVATVTRHQRAGIYINHPYIAWWRGRLWVMWSQGIGEDLAGQRVMLAWSRDGRHWSKPVILAARSGRAMIARGIWVDGDRLRAFVGDVSPDPFIALPRSIVPAGPKTLRTWPMWKEQLQGRWRAAPPILPGSLTNYPPVAIRGEHWLVLRAATLDMAVAIDRGTNWQRPTIEPLPRNPRLWSNEPIAYPIGGERYVLARSDNALKRIFYAQRRPDGRWSVRQPTGFPSATAKFFAVDLNARDRLLIGNFEPHLGRHMLVIAASRDGGRTFSRFYRLGTQDLASPYHTLLYPHAIVADGKLFIVASRDKQGIILITLKLPLETNEGGWHTRVATALVSVVGHLRTLLRGPYD